MDGAAERRFWYEALSIRGSAGKDVFSPGSGTGRITPVGGFEARYQPLMRFGSRTGALLRNKPGKSKRVGRYASAPPFRLTERG